MNDELKQLVMKLAGKGVLSIQSTGRGVLKINSQPGVVSSLFEDLLELQKFIEGVPVSSTEKDSFFHSAYFLELVIFGLGIYALTALGIMQFDDGQIHLDGFGLFIPGLILGLLAVLLWILFASLLLKKSSRAPVLLFESLWSLGLTLIVTGPQVVFDLNQDLDTSEPEAVLARVERKEVKVVRRRRSTTRKYYIHLNSNQNKYDIPKRLRVSYWDWDQFVEGSGISISVRQGFFDSPYIAGFSPATFTEEKPYKISDEEVKALKSYHPAPLKDWESLPELTWKEERYASGKLRQREPMVEGRQHGVASYWHENGVKYADIPWVNGQKHGKFTLYKEDGSIDQSLSYFEGALHGVITWYDHKGQVSYKELYQRGKLVKNGL
jgi:hypothetical protein